MQVVCDIIILSPVTALADAAQELVRVEVGDLVLRRLLHHNALVGVCVRDHHHEPVPHKPKQTLHRSLQRSLLTLSQSTLLLPRLGKLLRDDGAGLRRDPEGFGDCVMAVGSRCRRWRGSA